MTDDDVRFFWIFAGVLAVMAFGAAIFETIKPVATYSASGVLSTLIVTLAFVLAMLVAMLPTLIALMRHKRNTLAIGALNLLLGWTLIGWVVALIWALMHEAPSSTSLSTG